MKLEIVSNLD